MRLLLFLEIMLLTGLKNTARGLLMVLLTLAVSAFIEFDAIPDRGILF